ncbi:MAG: NUDIX domain-containing protein [Gammaproteobacteria bacterium]|nr:NUDIX domain-containing protein [Gammaproteobacteria bacterium]
MSEKEIPVPVPAATILILRDSPDGMEVFMVVRHHQIDFASGALVFPGGKVAAGDEAVRDRCTGAQHLDDTQFSLQVAAIREAFEECGILLAAERGSQDLIKGARLATLDHYQVPLSKGEMTIGEFLEKEDLVLQLDRLHHFAHWITPEMMPKRFDTHFYLAIAPADHIAVHDGHESVDSVWIKPEQALQEAQAGKRTIIFPTRLNIEMLARSQSVAEALKDAANRDIVTVTPWTEKRQAGVYLCIQPEAGYAVSEEKMEGQPA